VSNTTRPIGFDPPLAVMIALLAVGGGAYLAQRTLPEVPTAPRVVVVQTTGDWFSDFKALDASFVDARKAGAFAQPADPIMTGSVQAKQPASKTDRLGRDGAPPPKPAQKSAATPTAAPAGDGRQAMAGASAKASAFGALAPAPWLKIRVDASAVAQAPTPPKRAEVATLPLLPPVNPLPADPDRGLQTRDTALGYTGPADAAAKPFGSLFRAGTAEGTIQPKLQR
jgi:hypothetical protein